MTGLGPVATEHDLATWWRARRARPPAPGPSHRQWSVTRRSPSRGRGFLLCSRTGRSGQDARTRPGEDPLRGDESEVHRLVLDALDVARATSNDVRARNVAVEAGLSILDALEADLTQFAIDIERPTPRCDPSTSWATASRTTTATRACATSCTSTLPDDRPRHSYATNSTPPITKASTLGS
jgi:hypothetical protein